MKLFSTLQHIFHIRKARIARHVRTFIPEESVFLRESVRQVERVFFWRVVTISTLGLFFFSIIPQFAVSSSPSLSPPLETLGNEPREPLVFAEDGFLMKPELWTEVGDRSDVSGAIEYVVEGGDTISSIASRFGVTQRTILQNNDFPDPKKIRPGTVLKIPASDGLLYIVAEGDTITSIAKKYSIEEEKILRQNEISDSSSLQKGEEIIIPGAKKTEPRPVQTARIAGGNTFSSGAGVPLGRETYGRLLFPTTGAYTQYFHYGHYAVDIANSGGAPIWAANGGVVERASSGWNGGYGNMVVIDHGNGMKTLYAHLKEIYVSVGKNVDRGTPVGYMGNTGRVYGRTGIHLHFEVIVNGAKKNPVAYF